MPRTPSVAPSERSVYAPSRSAGQLLVCAACGAHVTDSSQRIAVGGEHEQTFVNPAGILYRVACFASAPGAVAIGVPSADFTWFPGYAWRVALCASCFAHLGWSFTGLGPDFLALVVDRLLEHDADRS